MSDQSRPRPSSGPGTADAERGGVQTKSHLYYGKITETASATAAAVREEEAPQELQPSDSEDRPLPSSESPQDGETGVQMDAAVAQHEEKLKAFQIQQTASSFKTSAPTIDADVRDALRRMGEPVTLFGEGPFERRARLKGLLAEGRTIPAGVDAPQRPSLHLGAPAARIIAVKKQQAKAEAGAGAAEAEEVTEEIEGTFYTEGQPALLAFRKLCAAASGQAAQQRLRRETVYRQHAQQLQQEKSLSCLPPSSPILDMHFFNKFIQQKMSLAASIVGDERPLTCCRFSPPSPLAAEIAAADARGGGSAGAAQGEAALRAEEEAQQLEFAGGSKTLLATASWGESSLLLASGSADATVCLWDLGRAAKCGLQGASAASAKLLVGKLTGHEERVNRVVFHPTGRSLATTSHDETWRLWDVETRQEILLQEGHSAAVYALCFHPDGSLAVTSDLMGLVKVTDLRVGRGVVDIAAHVKQVVALSVHPVCANWMVTGGDDNCVKLWDLRKVATTSAAARAAAAEKGTSAAACVSQALLTIPAHTKMITECIFEPGSGRCLYTSGFDGLVKVWSCTDFSLQKSLPAHDGKVMGIDILETSQAFPSGSAEGVSPLHKEVKEEHANGCSTKEDSHKDTLYDGEERRGIGGGDVVASVGFDRTWKLWHCNGLYSQQETRDMLLQQYKEEKPADSPGIFPPVHDCLRLSLKSLDARRSQAVSPSEIILRFACGSKPGVANGPDGDKQVAKKRKGMQVCWLAAFQQACSGRARHERADTANTPLLLSPFLFLSHAHSISEPDCPSSLISARVPSVPVSLPPKTNAPA
ncbi:U4/U6 small nuclear ribonucleoprotein Prp4 [Cyclospora cayetanensis]|uniref:U4/U6 small nuclear ribonucleoprotein Prp4 n=1 Tax=Cyclospora cayetanensis TaxID=88456 RepID=A0A6P6RVI3_9EIME|nr:U4/U6 small nuclear ribonucleoprotein Prp4 [Cyclospora cayetanensis]